MATNRIIGCTDATATTHIVLRLLRQLARVSAAKLVSASVDRTVVLSAKSSPKFTDIDSCREVS